MEMLGTLCKHKGFDGTIYETVGHFMNIIVEMKTNVTKCGPLWRHSCFDGNNDENKWKVVKSRMVLIGQPMN